MEELYRQVKWLGAGAVLLALYLAGLVTAVSAGSGDWTPWDVLSFCLTAGFPFWLFGLFLVLLLAAVCLWYAERKEELENRDPLDRLIRMAEARQPYGDSHFERPAEFASAALVQSPDRARGIIFGQLDLSGKRLINFNMAGNRLNQHIAVTGASGSGKTYTFTKPACFQYVKRRESVVITDPDGGLYSDMSSYFRDSGYHVFMLNLKDLEKSDGWNCLRSIDGPNLEINAQLFADTVITNLTDDMTSVYALGPMSILKALILKVMLSPDFPEEEKNIGTVYRLLQNPAGEAFLDSLFDYDSLTAEERPCHAPYMSFKQGSPNLRGNLITNLSVQLQLLQSDLVKTVLSTDGIDLELPGKEPTALFCLFPDNHDTYRFVVSLFFSMLFTRLADLADRNTANGRRLDVPVNFLLDEFPSIGVIPDFDRKIATIRKRAMNVTMIFQDITQLQNNYRDTWVTLVSNCSTLCCLGINDMVTAQWVQKRIGETTIQVRTDQHAAAESRLSVSGRHSTGEGRRSLLNPDELVRLGEDKTLILFQNHNPVLAYKLPYVDHPESKKLYSVDYYDPDGPGYVPDITCRAEREAFRQRERERVERFNERHPGINHRGCRLPQDPREGEGVYKGDSGLAGYLKSELLRYLRPAARAFKTVLRRIVRPMWGRRSPESRHDGDTGPDKPGGKGHAVWMGQDAEGRDMPDPEMQWEEVVFIRQEEPDRPGQEEAGRETKEGGTPEPRGHGASAGSREGGKGIEALEKRFRPGPENGRRTPGYPSTEDRRRASLPLEAGQEKRGLPGKKAGNRP